MKKLPIGISTFSKIIEQNYLYIDKTDIALDLIENYHYTFLSRPRRFGKSLFISTLKEIFEGNKKLFEGLYIYDKWDWEEKYPVIKISFGGSRSTDELKQSILKNLDFSQKNLGVTCQENYDYATCFSDLIQKSYEKYQKPVVILIDEYDKPILDNLDQMEVAIECREILKRLYTQIKENDRYIKFAFLTGVSKFSRASIFSGLNNLTDISMKPKYGNICGYTQNDIETTILPYLQGVDLERLKEWYNGYNFLKDRVYNPFDILLFIDNDFVYDNYWFNTGTPSFLIKLFKQNQYNLAKFENIEVGKELVNSFDIEDISLETVMFQAGYLTIKEVEHFGDNIVYYLTFPNIEVKKSFNDYILTNYFIQANRKTKVQISLYRQLSRAKLDELETTFKSLFASIAYNNFTKNDIQNYEGFYASVVYAYFAGAGFDRIVAEDATSDGRIDLSVFIDDKVYIFEFKVDGSSAMKQIKDKKYHEKYMSRYSEIYLVGVEFDKESRSLCRFEWEMV
ncbi:AAA family ATPase [Sulfurovum sp. bin170]|uniref:ATP-binding protein n=1 Tax=Sulfurovum sp. bin170 TaxID=2695268 RepID=UPI0013E07B79|nr:ATP-binding protein [Sulfurovum sp. bin170]NEW60125.1 AAA family ATPase [Sulfurovum sp. bin170]